MARREFERKGWAVVDVNDGFHAEETDGAVTYQVEVRVVAPHGRRRIVRQERRIVNGRSRDGWVEVRA